MDSTIHFKGFLVSDDATVDGNIPWSYCPFIHKFWTAPSSCLVPQNHRSIQVYMLRLITHHWSFQLFVPQTWFLRILELSSIYYALDNGPALVDTPLLDVIMSTHRFSCLAGITT